MTLHLDHLMAFRGAATLKSFGAAAKRLGISQQAVSGRIGKLEQAVGAALFERTAGRSGALTDEGKLLLPAFQQIIDLRAKAKRAAEHDERLSKPLRMGVMESVVHSFLPGLLGMLRANFPKLRLQLVVLASSKLEEMIQADELDLIITAISAADGEDVEVEIMRSMRMVLVGAPRATTRPVHDIAELVQAGVIAFQPKTPIHKKCLEVIEGATDNFVLHTVSSVSAMSVLLRAGYGVATLPEPVAKQLTHRQKDLVILECHPELPSLPIIVNWRNDASFPEHERVVAAITSFTKQVSASGHL